MRSISWFLIVAATLSRTALKYLNKIYFSLSWKIWLRIKIKINERKKGEKINILLAPRVYEFLLFFYLEIIIYPKKKNILIFMFHSKIFLVIFIKSRMFSPHFQFTRENYFYFFTYFFTFFFFVDEIRYDFCVRCAWECRTGQDRYILSSSQHSDNVQCYENKKILFQEINTNANAMLKNQLNYKIKKWRKKMFIITITFYLRLVLPT